LHLEIRPRVNLSRFDIQVTQEIPNHVERDSTLQQVHSFGIAERVRTQRSVQSRTPAACFGEIFLKKVTDSGTRESLVAPVLEKRLGKLFGTIEIVFGLSDGRVSQTKALSRCSHENPLAMDLREKQADRSGVEAGPVP
jgi:hypothetical protein